MVGVMIGIRTIKTVIDCRQKDGQQETSNRGDYLYFYFIDIRARRWIRHARINGWESARRMMWTIENAGGW